MNINQVKEGLRHGKRFLRVELRADGFTEKDRLSPSGFETENGYTEFRCSTFVDFGEFHGGAGGVAILSIDILPGRFEPEGWEELSV